MSPFHSDESADDLKKKWGGTYVRVDLGQGLHVVQIKEFLSNNKLVRCTHPEQGTIIIEHENLMWESELPPRGWFNTVGGAYFVIRLAERQWKRGLCEHTVNYVRPTASWRAALSGSLGCSASVGAFAHAQAAWDRHHVPFHDGVALLKKQRRLEVAVTDEVAITANPMSNKGMVIWYDLTPVGLYDDTKDVINVGNEVFYSELSDFIKRNQLSCSIHID